MHYPRCIARMHAVWQEPLHQSIMEGDNVAFHSRLNEEQLSHDTKMQWVVSRRIGFLFDKNADPKSPKCDLCWVSRRVCYCAKVPRVHTPHRFYVFAHFKEFLRTSNTGKLLLLGVQFANPDRPVVLRQSLPKPLPNETRAAPPPPPRGPIC